MGHSRRSGDVRVTSGYARFKHYLFRAAQESARTEVSATLQLAALVPSVGTTLANRFPIRAGHERPDN